MTLMKIRKVYNSYMFIFKSEDTRKIPNEVYFVRILEVILA